MSSELMGASKAEHEAFIADGRRRLNAIADMVMADAEMRRSVTAERAPRLGAPPKTSTLSEGKRAE